MHTSSDDELKQVFRTKIDDLYQLGITKPINSLSINDKIKIIQIISTNELLHIKAEIDQFIEGLECLGVLTAIQRYTDVVKAFFTIGKKVTLTAGKYFIMHTIIKINAKDLPSFTTLLELFWKLIFRNLYAL